MTRSSPAMISRRLSLAFALLLLMPVPAWSRDAPSASAKPSKLHRIAPQTPQELQDLFKPTGEPFPFVSAHRGGSAKGWPENCLATFEHTIGQTFAILEIDPRYAKDGNIVVFHDATLERTSTGQGRVADLTLAELKQLKLKDSEGGVTEYQIPTLDEALEWARGRTILVLDQKDVPAAERVRKITEHKAEAYAMMIVSNFKDVQACHALNPKIMMEVMIPDRAKAVEFDKLGVPWRNVVAFVGHTPPEDEGLYALIHAKGAACMVGSSRNLDRQFTSGQAADLGMLEPGYRAFLKRGADIIETDIPRELGPLLFNSIPPPATKKAFFSMH